MSEEKRACPKCGSERTKHTERIAVCYACNHSWLLKKVKDHNYRDWKGIP